MAADIVYDSSSLMVEDKGDAYLLVRTPNSVKLPKTASEEEFRDAATDLTQGIPEARDKVLEAINKWLSGSTR